MKKYFEIYASNRNVFVIFVATLERKALPPKGHFGSESVLRYYLCQKIPNFLKPCKSIATNACAFLYKTFFIHDKAQVLLFICVVWYGDTSDTNKALNSFLRFRILNNLIY